MLTAAVAARVAETATTAGTGTFDLAGPLSRYQGFVAAFGTGRLVEYTIVHRTQPEWEVGVGTITDGAPDTLSRTRIRASSNAGALVNFSAGTKDVFCAAPPRRGLTAPQAYLAAAL